MRGVKVGGGYSFVACLRHFTMTTHPFRDWSTVPTFNRPV